MEDLNYTMLRGLVLEFVNSKIQKHDFKDYVALQICVSKLLEDFPLTAKQKDFIFLESFTLISYKVILRQIDVEHNKAHTEVLKKISSN